MRWQAFVLCALLFTGTGATASASDWSLDCKPDKMTDKSKCSLSAMKHEGPPHHRFVMVGFEGGMLVVSSGSRPLEARVRVDSNPAIITKDCPGGFCIFSSAQTSAALRQMRNGTRVLADCATLDGRIGPLEFALAGFDGLVQQMQGRQGR